MTSGAHRRPLQLSGLALVRSDGTLFADGISSRRGGRAVDCAGLENRKAERPREFESHPLRFLTLSSCGKPERLTEPLLQLPILNSRSCSCLRLYSRTLTSALLMCSVNSDQRSPVTGVRARTNTKRWRPSPARGCRFCRQRTCLIQRLALDGADMGA
jgi:hypothetical protein